MLYESLRTKLLTLPDSSLVYPAHGAGSLCGKAISKETVSTIGEQRRVNYALQPMTKAAFVDLVTADQPDAPAYFTYDAVLNSKERPTLDQAMARELNPMTLELVLALQRTGGQILDTRDSAEFAAAHLAGSLNIGLGGQFATWAGTLLDPARPIVIIADPGRENEAALRLGRIGFDHIVGYLQDGLQSLAARPELTATTERVSGPLAAERLAEPVRTRAGRADARRTRAEVASSAASACRSINSPAAQPSYRETGRCWCTAQVATDRRWPPACCRTPDSRRSAKSPVASPAGRPRSCLLSRHRRHCQNNHGDDVASPQATTSRSAAHSDRHVRVAAAQRQSAARHQPERRRRLLDTSRTARRRPDRLAATHRSRPGDVTARPGYFVSESSPPP